MNKQPFALPYPDIVRRLSAIRQRFEEDGGSFQLTSVRLAVALADVCDALDMTDAQKRTVLGEASEMPYQIGSMQFTLLGEQP